MRIELAANEQRCPHRLEISRRNPVEKRQPIHERRGVEALGLDYAVPAPSADRDNRRTRCGDHAGEGAQTLDGFTVDANALRLGHGGLLEVRVDHEHVLPLEARVDSQQVAQGPQKQARSNQQHERQGHLADDERFGRIEAGRA